MPDADIKGNVGRRSSFEVVVNGKAVYSKLSTGAFPDYSALAAAIKEGKY
jgi:selT/selW/selH-like putative selenoprotein